MSNMLSPAELEAALKQIADDELKEMLEQIRLSEEASPSPEKPSSEKKADADTLSASSNLHDTTEPLERKRRTEDAQLGNNTSNNAHSNGAASKDTSPKNNEATPQASNTDGDFACAFELGIELERKRQEEREALKQNENAARQVFLALNGKPVEESMIDATVNDATIAAAMQAQLGNNHTNTSNMVPGFHTHLERKATDEDATIAKLMQAEEDEKAARRSSSAMLLQYKYQIMTNLWDKIPKEERKDVEEKLQAILNSEGVSPPMNSDAHAFTRTCIREGLKYLFELETRFKISNENLPADQILQEVLAFVELNEAALKKMREEKNENQAKNEDSISIDNIKTTFSRIPGEYAAEAGSGGETQANVYHVLSRAWDLAKKNSEQGNPTEMGNIAMILHFNIHDKGGCIPGLIARLFRPYALMFGAQLGLEPTIKKDYSNKP